MPQATFYVLSDPTAVKQVLSLRPFDYDKGLLAEILKPILGKGLIPADIKTWQKYSPSPASMSTLHTRTRTHMFLNYCNGDVGVLERVTGEVCGDAAGGGRRFSRGSTRRGWTA